MLNNYEVSIILLSREVGKILSNDKLFHTPIFWKAFNWINNKCETKDYKELVEYCNIGETFKEELLKGVEC